MAQKLRPQAETLSGSPQPNFVGYSVSPILAKRAPTTTDTGYPLAQLWLDKTGDDLYGLVDVSAGIATWNLLAATPGEIATLTGDTGGAIGPSAGNVNLLGTSEQISTTGSGSTITLAIPNTFSFGSASGSNSGTITTGTGGLNCQLTNGPFIVSTGTGQIDISSDVTNTTVNIGISSGSAVKTVNVGSPHSTSITTIAAGSAGIVLNAVGGSTSCTTDFSLSSVATKISLNGGAATDFIGTATLTSGTVTVSNTNISTADRILVTRSAVNASSALGVFKVVKTGSTNFIITACKPADATTETGDASTVDYIIFRQT
jgi:hypothetical protein